MTHHDRFSKDHRENWTAFVQSICPAGDLRAARLMDDFRMVAHQVYQLGEASLDTSGLSYAQYRILMGLRYVEWKGERNGLNPSAISALQGTGRNTVSALIRSLEAEGLVERQLDMNDRRRFNIHLTEAGRRLVHENAGHHVRMIDDLFEVLSDSEIEALSSSLKKLGKRARSLKS